MPCARCSTCAHSREEGKGRTGVESDTARTRRRAPEGATRMSGYGPRPRVTDREALDLDSDASLVDEARGLVPPDVLESWKQLTGKLARLRRLAQQVEKAAQRWDVRQLRQRLPELSAATAETTVEVRSAEAALAEWSPAQSAQSVAAYAEDLARTAVQLKLSLSGEFPEYEAFPLAVRVDLAAEHVAIGRRRVSGLEPSALLREVQRSHQALHRSSFNARRFMQSLASAHELLKKSGAAKGNAVPLSDIYDLLTLRSGSSAYTRQEFAFDIYRLRRESDLLYGRYQISFQHARRGGIPVPNAQGGVELFGALELWEVEGSD